MRALEHVAAGRIGVAFLTALSLTRATIPVAAGAAKATEAPYAKRWAEMGWPNWRGPYSNGSAAPCGEELVESSADAVLLWQSEATNLPTSFWTAPGWVEVSGFSDVAIANGRVYMFYYRRAGGIIDRDRYARLTAEAHLETDRERRYWSSLDADDIVICMDAENGRTLWRTVRARRGLNYHDRGGGHGPQCTPCVGNGKVYAVGSAGRIYALDAATGRPIWEMNSGDEAERIQYGLRRRRRDTPHGMFDSCPTIADGVLVCNTHAREPSGRRGRKGCPIAGFDCETGQKLWVVPQCIAGMGCSPVRWVHKGKEYVIAATERRAVCVEPRTGRVLWEINGPVHRSGTPAVCENYVVFAGTTNTHGTYRVKEDTVGMTCYRITPDGAVKVWGLSPLNYALGNDSSPIIQDGWVYAGLMGVHGKIGGFTCVDLATGTVLGVARIKTGYSPIAAPGRAFTTTGVMIMGGNDFGRNLRRPRFFKPHPYSHATYTAVAVAHGRLYVRGRNTVQCYELKKAAAEAHRAPEKRALKTARADPALMHLPPWKRGMQPKEDATPTPVSDAPPQPSDPDALLAQLNARYETDRNRAAAALAALDPTIREPILRRLVAMLGGQSWPARKAAASTLERIGADAARTAPQVRTFLAVSVSKQSMAEAELAIRVLRAVQPESMPEVVGDLTAMLDAGEVGVTRSACAAIALAGRARTNAVPALVTILSSTNAVTCAAAARTLSGMGPYAGPAAAHLVRCLGAGDPDVVLQSAKALSSMGRASTHVRENVLATLPSLEGRSEVLDLCIADIRRSLGALEEDR